MEPWAGAASLLEKKGYRITSSFPSLSLSLSLSFSPVPSWNPKKTTKKKRDPQTEDLFCNHQFHDPWVVCSLLCAHPFARRQRKSAAKERKGLSSLADQRALKAYGYFLKTLPEDLLLSFSYALFCSLLLNGTVSKQISLHICVSLPHLFTLLLSFLSLYLPLFSLEESWILGIVGVCSLQVVVTKSTIHAPNRSQPSWTHQAMLVPCLTHHSHHHHHLTTTTTTTPTPHLCSTHFRTTSIPCHDHQPNYKTQIPYWISTWSGPKP